MGRFPATIVVAGLVASGGWVAVSRAAEPLAIVSAVKGKVEVVQAPSKKPKAASFGLALMRGDKITVGRGGSATLFFSDGNVIQLGEQSSVTVNERVDKPAKAEIASEVFTQVSGYVTAGSRQTGLGAASSMRGKEEGPFLLSPRRTSRWKDDRRSPGIAFPARNAMWSSLDRGAGVVDARDLRHDAGLSIGHGDAPWRHGHPVGGGSALGCGAAAKREHGSSDPELRGS
jgi:hypothetical protein